MQVRAMAEKALRRLYKYVGLLDPSIVDYLYAEFLITKPEHEKIIAEGDRTNKTRLILGALGNRDGKKAIEGLIEALEQEKEANETFLRKIEEGRRHPCCYYHVVYECLLISFLLCIIIAPHIDKQRKPNGRNFLFYSVS